jgi:hypothetical protein
LFLFNIPIISTVSAAAAAAAEEEEEEEEEVIYKSLHRDCYFVPELMFH